MGLVIVLTNRFPKKDPYELEWWDWNLSGIKAVLPLLPSGNVEDSIAKDSARP